MTTIAQPSRVFLALMGLMLTPIILRPFFAFTPLTALWSMLGMVVFNRLMRLGLSVSSDHVVVRNFFRTTEIPIWEAEVEREESGDDDILAELDASYGHDGRTLFIKRLWHNDRIRVGVAPRFGPEAERIYRQLVEEIKRARAGNAGTRPAM